MTRQEYYDMRIANLIKRAEDLRDYAKQVADKGDEDLAELLRQKAQWKAEENERVNQKIEVKN